MRRVFALCGLVLALSGCAAPASPTPRILPTVSATSSPTETIVPTPTKVVGASPAATQLSVASTPTLTATPLTGVMVCTAAESSCIVPGHFIFRRPFKASANNEIDQTYRYGATQNDLRDPHHGVDFPNAQGTHVLAAGDGRVVVAGNDKLEKYGLYGNFYGNLVVIAHDVPGVDAPVYTLYGHLFKVLVKPGQQVRVGDLIGEVGATGIAIGSHLHLEVRIGNDDYKSTRNPELWVHPPPGMGVLAGRVLDAQGNLVSSTVNVQRLQGDTILPDPIYLAETYARESLHGDDVLNENFAVGELPAGDYRLTLIYNGRVYEQRVKIAAGSLTIVDFRL